jgi:glycosyltransferase involved in cell wall biosynthesis
VLARKGSLQVTLVATLLNEEDSLPGWWRSITEQTRLPDEVIVVDGGSWDNTVALLQALSTDAPFSTHIEVLRDSNIAEGRNQAIAKASHDVIAVTDGGCVLDKNWLENIVAPMESDGDVSLVAGFYQPLPGNWFQDLVACATIPTGREIREASFMPSSRSLAFKKVVWDEAGGYPEWLEIGEDMYFNHAWKQAGIKHVMAAEALVYWKMRENLGSLFKQYFLYARGDGQSGMYPERHALRFATYGAIAFIGGTRNRKLAAAALPPALVYAGKRWQRIPSYMGGRPAWQKMASIPAISGLMFLIDVAKMAGYLSGLRERKP